MHNTLHFPCSLPAPSSSTRNFDQTKRKTRLTLSPREPYDARSASNGSAAAPFGASASSRSRACASDRRTALLTFGYCGSSSISVVTITAEAQIRANHLRSAGITCQGAQDVLVWLSISEKACW